MQIDAVKKYVVELDGDKGLLEASLWRFIGEFNGASRASDVCRRINVLK